LGTTSSQKITRPAGLQAATDKFHQVAELANDDQLREFVAELHSAFLRAIETDDLRPIDDTIEGWWRSLRLMHHPRYEDSVRAAMALTAKDRIPVGEFLTELRGR
jgi:hypothetical protein